MVFVDDSLLPAKIPDLLEPLMIFPSLLEYLGATLVLTHGRVL